MSQPFFSVVIPTYNRARRVAAAVRSVLWQTDPDFECLLVDDGSTDDTAERLSPIKDSRLRVFYNKQNRGQHACRNQAIRESRGQWIAFLDSDDLFLPGRLAALRRSIAARPNASFWFCNAYIHRFGRVIGTMFDPNRSLPQGRVPGYYAVGDEYLPYVTSTVALPRRAFDQVGFFREDLRILEDTELYARMLKAGLETGSSSEPWIVRFIHESQITRDHERDFAESMEALRAGDPGPEVFARIRRKVALEVAEHIYRSAEPRRAREFLVRELGPSSRWSGAYLKTFVPAWPLAGLKKVRQASLVVRHAPLLAGGEIKEVYRLINPLIEA